MKRITRGEAMPDSAKIRLRWRAAGHRAWARIREIHERGALLGSGLALCAAAVTLWLAAEVVLTPGTPAWNREAKAAGAATEQAKPAKSGVGEGQERGSADLQSYLSAIAGRPLFRPPEGGARGDSSRLPVSLSSLAGEFELAGVVGGESLRAIIRDKKTGEVYYLSVGQTLGELTVTGIGPRSVILLAGKEEIKLEL